VNKPGNEADQISCEPKPLRFLSMHQYLTCLNQGCDMISWTEALDSGWGSRMRRSRSNRASAPLSIIGSGKVASEGKSLNSRLVSLFNMVMIFEAWLRLTS